MDWRLCIHIFVNLRQLVVKIVKTAATCLSGQCVYLSDARSMFERVMPDSALRLGCPRARDLSNILAVIQPTEQRHFVHWSGMRPRWPGGFVFHMSSRCTNAFGIPFACGTETSARSCNMTMTFLSKPGLIQDLSGCHLLCNSSGPTSDSWACSQPPLICSFPVQTCWSYAWFLPWPSSKALTRGVKIPPCWPSLFYPLGPWQGRGLLSVGPWTGRKRCGNCASNFCSRDSSQTPSQIWPYCWVLTDEPLSLTEFSDLSVDLKIFGTFGMALACCGYLWLLSPLDHWICDASYTLLALAIMNSALDRHCLRSLAFNIVLSRYSFSLFLHIKLYEDISTPIVLKASWKWDSLAISLKSNWPLNRARAPSRCRRIRLCKPSAFGCSPRLKSQPNTFLGCTKDKGRAMWILKKTKPPHYYSVCEWFWAFLHILRTHELTLFWMGSNLQVSWCSMHWLQWQFQHHRGYPLFSCRLTCLHIMYIYIPSAQTSYIQLLYLKYQIPVAQRAQHARLPMFVNVNVAWCRLQTKAPNRGAPSPSIFASTGHHIEIGRRWGNIDGFVIRKGVPVGRVSTTCYSSSCNLQQQRSKEFVHEICKKTWMYTTHTHIYIYCICLLISL